MDIGDIAKLAGVSPSTVSKVINHKDASISASTRERVLKVVRDYHYTPYSRARANRDWLIGVIFRSPISLDSTLDGILSVAQQAGYATLVFDSNADLEQERKNIAAVKSAGATGIIWEPVNENSLEDRASLETGDARVLTIGSYGGDQSLLLPYEVAAYDITNELVRRGHERIACLVTEGRRTRDFIKGFKRCLFENGLAFGGAQLFTEVSSELFTKVGTGEITGIVCSHYQIAATLYARLESLHYHAPDDVSIVSLRNDAGTSWIADTNDVISTYTIRNSDFGRIACGRLIDQIEGREQSEEFFQSFSLDNENSIGQPSAHQPKHAVVVGSINIDTRLSVPALPNTGTTVTTRTSLVYPGGKGANEAVGLAKLGHRVVLVGDVGVDSSSDMVYQVLEGYGVDTSGIYRKPGTETGRAYIFVDQQGESMIGILSGANASLQAHDVHAREELFEGAQYCLVQSEIPMEAVAAACDVARAHGSRVIFKPASCKSIPDEVISRVSVLVPNQTELEAICPEGSSLEERAELLLERGVEAVVVTLGAEGCYVHTAAYRESFPAAPFESIDTTGAGDAFVSALAACLLDGDDLRLAVMKANYAAGFSTTREGVASSLIDRYTLERAFQGQ